MGNMPSLQRIKNHFIKLELIVRFCYSDWLKGGRFRAVMRHTILSLPAVVSDAGNLCMMNRVIGLASARRACRMKQPYVYVQRNATVQIIISSIAV